MRLYTGGVTCSQWAAYGPPTVHDKGHTKKILKGELDGLEALHRVGANLSEGFSFPPAIVSPSPSRQRSSSPQLSEFFMSLRTPTPFFENEEDVS
jgi:hypothetical protein